MNQKISEILGKNKKNESSEEGSLMLVSQKKLDKALDKVATIERGAEKNADISHIEGALEILGNKINEKASDEHEHVDYLDIQHFLKYTKDILKRHKFTDAELAKYSLEVKRLEKKNAESFDKYTTDIAIKFAKLEEELLKEGERKHSSLKGLEWSKSGHVMDSVLDMDGNTITNIPDPKNASDVVPKGYLEKLVQKVAGSLRVSNVPAGSPVTKDYYTREEIDNLDHIIGDGVAKITVGTVEPTGPATGDLWVDTN